MRQCGEQTTTYMSEGDSRLSMAKRFKKKMKTNSPFTTTTTRRALMDGPGWARYALESGPAWATKEELWSIQSKTVRYSPY